MVFLDINTFYSPKAGGIRTYQDAKIAWFRAHPEHRYTVLFPGPARRAGQDGPVRLVEGYGPALTADPKGYRLLVDALAAWRLLRAERPAVLEAGDPWLTGLFCLLLRRLGLYQGLLVSFYHSDPVPSYLVPWASRGGSAARALKGLLARALGALFYRMQRGYDLTAVSSRAMEASLLARGVRTVVRLPFGVPAPYLEPAPSRAARPDGAVRLLYCGRLDREKGVDLLLEALPRILELPGAMVSVAGRGAYADRFAAFAHSGYRYLGFLEGWDRVRAAYDDHDVMLAPGPFETFGLGVLEAMARGLIVVGPDRGGTGELLTEAGSPFVFRAGDVEDFLRAVRAAAGADRGVEARRSRGVAERYGTWDEAVARMVARYAKEARAQEAGR